MRTELQASSQSCRSVDADAWCKRALKFSKANIVLILEGEHDSEVAGPGFNHL